jgi:predicted Zn-dependent protease
MLYAESLTKQRKFNEAEAVLTRQSLVRSHDIDVWYELAEVSGLAGNIIGVHRARAEYFALHGSYERAIQHLEYARRLADQTTRRCSRASTSASTTCAQRCAKRAPEAARRL